MLLILSLAGCANPTATSGTSLQRAVCTSFEYIGWSSRDTDETIFQVKGHNAVMESFNCPIPLLPE